MLAEFSHNEDNYDDDYYYDYDDAFLEDAEFQIQALVTAILAGFLYHVGVFGLVYRFFFRDQLHIRIWKDLREGVELRATYGLDFDQDPAPEGNGNANENQNGNEDANANNGNNRNNMEEEERRLLPRCYGRAAFAMRAYAEDQYAACAAALEAVGEPTPPVDRFMNAMAHVGARAREQQSAHLPPNTNERIN